MTQLLSDAEVQARIKELESWAVEGNQLKRTFKFQDFLEAIAFINDLVEPAEASGHHPDIEISYNRVTLSLTTHDAGGLTEKDFELAKILSQFV
ncbi:MAG: 4a-hydroxytetrahydrobiopterin dehydratase [Scytolyngbya sp. HA4215-MV1]|nr:4a-hydroxytetrahydrobiopterin dehydratase [Scytolyngbya sp. HA4215-MV1]